MLFPFPIATAGFRVIRMRSLRHPLRKPARVVRADAALGVGAMCWARGDAGRVVGRASFGLGRGLWGGGTGVPMVGGGWLGWRSGRSRPMILAIGVVVGGRESWFGLS